MEAEVSQTYEFEGHVDFCLYHPPSKGWFVGGWLSHPWPLGHRPNEATAEFSGGTADRTYSMYHFREDVSGRGIGFVFFMGSVETRGQVFRSMRIQFENTSYLIYAAPNALALDEGQLLEHLESTLAGGEDGSHHRKMHELLAGERAPQSAEGMLDYYGYHAAAGGWLFCGWITRGWREGKSPNRIMVSFQEGDVDGEAYATRYPRHDLKNGEEGIVLFVRGPATTMGSLCTVNFEAGALRAILYVAPSAARLREAELVSRLRPLVAQAAEDRQRDILLGLLNRRPYVGEDTLAGLDVTVFIEVDEAIRCGPDGLLLMGWCLAKPGDLREIRVRCGPLISVLDVQNGIRVDRPDVLEGFSAHGFDDPCCGFIVFLPNAVLPDSRLYFEIETHRHEVGYRNIPRPKLEGIAAMKRLLAAVDVRFADVPRAFDRVLGPAVEGLNRQRLATRPAVSVVEYGTMPKTPRFSVIVPLYGRLDFVEYQMALFSAHPPIRDVEFVYVLDDPPKRREAQFLFASVYERFLVPFRALLLDRNVGFAPANNIGLQHAHGEYVAYLNSDVFPGTLDWLERLADRLMSDPTLGVIGPTLVYEDGSVQHRGMHFERLPEFGNWFFGQHQGKGMRHPENTGAVEQCLSITGACMLMRRDLAEQVGGFDEVFVVGDFEDTDLCLKLRAMGLGSGVDPDVRLFHLERKSQAGSGLGWRMNLTLYNAWQHERRWGETILQAQAA